MKAKKILGVYLSESQLQTKDSVENVLLWEDTSWKFMSLPGINKITAHQGTWNIVSSSTRYHTQWKTIEISVDTQVWACKY